MLLIYTPLIYTGFGLTGVAYYGYFSPAIFSTGYLNFSTGYLDHRKYLTYNCLECSCLDVILVGWVYMAKTRVDARRCIAMANEACRRPVNVLAASTLQ